MADEREKITIGDVRELLEVARRNNFSEWRGYASPMRVIGSREEVVTPRQYSRFYVPNLPNQEEKAVMTKVVEKIPNTPLDEFRALLRQAQNPISAENVSAKLLEHAVISDELQQNPELLTEEQRTQLIESMKNLASALGQNKQSDRLKEILEKGGQSDRGKVS